MTEEDEEFNRIEMESRIKQDYVRDIKKPSREALLAEVTVLTEMVRVLSDKMAELEAKQEQGEHYKGVIEGVQKLFDDKRKSKQEHGGPVMWDASSPIVVHPHPAFASPQRTWAGLTNDDWNSTAYDTEFRAGAEWAEDILKEKNT